MDPYVRLSVGQHRQCSQVCVNGAKTPFWNSSVTINLPEIADFSLKVEVLSQGTFSDRLVGWAEIPIIEAYQGRRIEAWHHLTGKQGKDKEGVINLAVSFQVTLHPTRAVCSVQALVTATPLHMQMPRHLDTTSLTRAPTSPSGGPLRSEPSSCTSRFRGFQMAIALSLPHRDRGGGSTRTRYSRGTGCSSSLRDSTCRYRRGTRGSQRTAYRRPITRMGRSTPRIVPLPRPTCTSILPGCHCSSTGTPRRTHHSHTAWAHRNRSRRRRRLSQPRNRRVRSTRARSSSLRTCSPRSTTPSSKASLRERRETWGRPLSPYCRCHDAVFYLIGVNSAFSTIQPFSTFTRFLRRRCTKGSCVSTWVAECRYVGSVCRGGSVGVAGGGGGSGREQERGTLCLG